MKIGLIQERKNPPDRRVVLSPKACQHVIAHFPDTEIIVESSPIRAFSDEAYSQLGFPLVDRAVDADVLLGVKEVPVEAIIPNKKYFFFSHTIKKQPYNRKLLKAILEKKIELYDHETLTDQNGIRLVAFGYYAGVVGAYNGIRTFGLKSGLFAIPKASELPDKRALIKTLRSVSIPGIKIVLTGKGRVGGGAKEILDAMGVKEVTVTDFIQKVYDHPVYVQLDALDYNKRADGSQGNAKEFYSHPERYVSDFTRFTKVADVYIAGHFYGAGAPVIFSKEDAASPGNAIKVVADISCDIDGPIAPTIRASTIAEPVYGYDPITGLETRFTNSDAIAVMAVDNLPCELPVDASEGFGQQFIQHVLPAFFDGDSQGILERARMTRDGKLTPRYAYLQDYVDNA